MNEGRAVFSQLINFLPDREFRRCVERYRGDIRLRGFSCWDQYLAMAFAQLTYRESLRDIEACLRSMQGKLYHLGFRGKVARSTLGRMVVAHFAHRRIPLLGNQSPCSDQFLGDFLLRGSRRSGQYRRGQSEEAEQHEHHGPVERLAELRPRTTGNVCLALGRTQGSPRRDPDGRHSTGISPAGEDEGSDGVQFIQKRYRDRGHNQCHHEQGMPPVDTLEQVRTKSGPPSTQPGLGPDFGRMAGNSSLIL